MVGHEPTFLDHFIEILNIKTYVTIPFANVKYDYSNNEESNTSFNQIGLQMAETSKLVAVKHL